MYLKITGSIIIALALCSCTGGGSKSSGSGGFSSLPGSWSTPATVEKLSQEPITLTVDSPTKILNEISSGLKANASRATAKSDKITSFESYLGEYLYIPLAADETSFKMTSKPDISSFSLKKSNANLVFMSVYDSSFAIQISGNADRNITVTNKCKYDFSENDLYSIIDKNYANKDMKRLKDSVDLYKLVFPNSGRLKDASVRLLDLAGTEGNSKIVRSEYNFINKFSSFNASDKTTVINALAAANVKDVTLPQNFLDYSSDNDINKKIGAIIIAKNAATKDEIDFLEKLFNEVPDKAYSNYIGNWYTRNGNPTLGNEYLAGSKAGVSSNELGALTPGAAEPLKELAAKNYDTFKQYYSSGENAFRNELYSDAMADFEKAASVNKNYSETSRLNFYMGQCAFNTGKYQVAVDNYKKALNTEKTSDKKAELYYNIGLAYHKTGNINDCKNYMTRIVQDYKGSTWDTKARLYLSKLN